MGVSSGTSHKYNAHAVIQEKAVDDGFTLPAAKRIVKQVKWQEGSFILSACALEGILFAHCAQCGKKLVTNGWSPSRGKSFAIQEIVSTVKKEKTFQTQFGFLWSPRRNCITNNMLKTIWLFLKLRGKMIPLLRIWSNKLLPKALKKDFVKKRNFLFHYQINFYKSLERKKPTRIFLECKTNCFPTK